MSLSRLLTAAFLLLLPLAPAPAAAGLLIDKSLVVFDPKRAREDLLLTNQDDETLYIEIDVLDVQGAGTAEEKWEKPADPERIGVVAAPRRLAIPAGGQRLVRLVNVGGHGDAERVYRLQVKPVTGGTEVKAGPMALKVMLNYQLLVVVPPQQPAWEWKGQRDGRQLHLVNTGNANVFLYDGKQCNGDDCATLPALRLYPGNSRTIELPRDAPVSFQVTTGKATEPHSFP